MSRLSPDGDVSGSQCQVQQRSASYGTSHPATGGSYGSCDDEAMP